VLGARVRRVLKIAEAWVLLRYPHPPLSAASSFMCCSSSRNSLKSMLALPDMRQVEGEREGGRRQAIYVARPMLQGLAYSAVHGFRGDGGCQGWNGVEVGERGGGMGQLEREREGGAVVYVRCMNHCVCVCNERGREAQTCACPLCCCSSCMLL
jgi:hypothetical protein